MLSINPTTPAPVAVWRRLLWVGLGAGTIPVATFFARIMTPDVPTFVDDDGFEYSQGGMFGNLFESLAWFGVSWVVAMIAVIWFAHHRTDNAGDYPQPGRTMLVWLGPVAFVIVLIGLGSLRRRFG